MTEDKPFRLFKRYWINKKDFTRNPNLYIQFDHLVKYDSVTGSINGGELAPEYDYNRNIISGLEQHVVNVYGKLHYTPRLVAYYSDDPSNTYMYSGTVQKVSKFTPTLLEIKQHVEAKILRYFGVPIIFNSCLVNFYRDGNDKIGEHSDDEKDLVVDDNMGIVIASVSLGATRKFNMRRRSTKEYKTYELHNGSLFLMYGDTQKRFTHFVNAQKRIKAPRINITFRTVVDKNK